MSVSRVMQSRVIYAESRRCAAARQHLSGVVERGDSEVELPGGGAEVGQTPGPGYAGAVAPSGFLRKLATLVALSLAAFPFVIRWVNIPSSMNPDIRNVPLFADLDDAQLEVLIAATESRKLPAGHVLFEKGAVADCWFLLLEGAISVRDEDGERFLVRAVNTVGELSVFTEEERRLSAVVVEPSNVLFLPRAELKKLLESNGPLAFGLMRGLLRLTGRKIGRDQRRLREMRENLVTTQKAMKRMQEFLLEAEDNPLHAALFEELDALVEQNKRWHYLVEPSRLVPTLVRLDAGVTLRVTSLSNEWIHFDRPNGVELTAGQDWSGVLLLDGSEVPVSGTLDRVTDAEVLVFLDELIPEYDALLGSHLARAQMLDVVL